MKTTVTASALLLVSNFALADSYHGIDEGNPDLYDGFPTPDSVNVSEETRVPGIMSGDNPDLYPAQI